ncbi:MAG: ribbon-helix-helix domain-containing protein [Sulfolobales archaeon]|jgi:Arc/MetJ-type ribon-helix-helix transcriptional regulator
MKIVSVKIPRTYLEDIDRLVKEGFYTSRSEFIRTALRILLAKELNRLSGKRSSEENFYDENFLSSIEEEKPKKGFIKKVYLDL